MIPLFLLRFAAHHFILHFHPPYSPPSRSLHRPQVYTALKGLHMEWKVLARAPVTPMTRSGHTALAGHESAMQMWRFHTLLVSLASGLVPDWCSTKRSEDCVSFYLFANACFCLKSITTQPRILKKNGAANAPIHPNQPTEREGNNRRFSSVAKRFDPSPPKLSYHSGSPIRRGVIV